jgi:hypothetical protein
MKKSELLALLADDYQKTVRLPDDVSLKDFKEAIERKTGLRISDKRATKSLNDRDDLVSLIVVERGKVVRVWRKKSNSKRRKRVKP